MTYWEIPQIFDVNFCQLSKCRKDVLEIILLQFSILCSSRFASQMFEETYHVELIKNSFQSKRTVLRRQIILLRSWINYVKSSPHPYSKNFIISISAPNFKSDGRVVIVSVSFLRLYLIVRGSVVYFGS